MNQPIYVGFSILDLSKYHMDNFHYGFTKSRYRSDSKLLFTDTDSLCYEITTEDSFQNMFTCKEQFNLNDIKIEKFQDSENKKVKKVRVICQCTINMYIDNRRVCGKVFD